MRTIGILAAVAALTVVVGAASPRAQGPAAAPAPDAAAVARGAALARIGDCAVCHTAPGGKPYAGGLPIKTPFGVVYSTNITPDVTGIGGWSLGDFDRALRDGIGKGRGDLYPALPYDHYTHLADGDVADLYAFIVSRQPVKATAPHNRLIFPLGFRPLLGGWKLLFLKKGPLPTVAGHTAEWNRGRYLAEALGHCGACHTPRNALGAERAGRAYAGGWSDGWFAPPLDRTSPAAGAWTTEALHTYLRSGLSPAHAAAAGPMGAVTRELSGAPDADVRAIAVYIASTMGGAHQPGGVLDRPALAAQAQPRGATLFAGACAACHEAGAPMMGEGRPNLALGTPLHEADPRDVIQIVLQGLAPPVGRAGPMMPAFAASLTDADVAALTAYLRARYSDQPPWPGDLARAVAKARKEGGR